MITVGRTKPRSGRRWVARRRAGGAAGAGAGVGEVMGPHYSPAARSARGATSAGSPCTSRRSWQYVGDGDGEIRERAGAQSLPRQRATRARVATRLGLVIHLDDA